MVPVLPVAVWVPAKVSPAVVLLGAVLLSEALVLPEAALLPADEVAAFSLSAGVLLSWAADALSFPLLSVVWVLLALCWC